MSIRFYLVPKDGDGLTHFTAIRPKYIADAIVGPWQAMDYGQEDWMLVAADVTPTEHSTIAANADVVAVPANLNNTVGAQLGTVQSKLEAANIPADWVTSGMTYRIVLKWTIRIILLMQRFHGLDGAAARFFNSGLTLDSTVSDLPVAVRQRLAAAAARWNLDITGITGSTTIRAALRYLGQQMTFGVKFGGEAL